MSPLVQVLSPFSRAPSAFRVDAMSCPTSMQGFFSSLLMRLFSFMAYLLVLFFFSCFCLLLPFCTFNKSHVWTLRLVFFLPFYIDSYGYRTRSDMEQGHYSEEEDEGTGLGEESTKAAKEIGSHFLVMTNLALGKNLRML